MLSDFENVSLALPSLTDDRWTGTWHRLGAATHSKQTLAVEHIGSEPCDQFALHTTGHGLSQPVGIGFNFKGTASAPEVYDGTRWAGIRFRARFGDETTKTVRLNIVTPWTADTSECTALEDSDCSNHLGRFLRDEDVVTGDWREFAFCFDRDLYPLEVPSGLTDEQRRRVAEHLLEVQFQFNRSRRLPETPSAAAQYPEEPADASFDFWVDDVELIEDPDECAAAEVEWTQDTTRPYPRNAKLGSCEPAYDAVKFNAAIARAYTRWRERYILWDDHGCRVDWTEPGLVNSQAVGYAMLIAAAMGDRAVFDGLWAYARAEGAAAWLMAAEPNEIGSCTEGDEDIAHALLVADEQWQGEYKTHATTLLANMAVSDVSDDSLLPGSEWAESGAFMPAQFVPSFYRVFERATGHDTWARVLAKGYQTLRSNAQAFGDIGLVTDLCDAAGTPTQESDYGLEVTGGFTEPVYGFYAARVPLRLSWDVCLEGELHAKDLLAGILNFFVDRYDGGASIEHLAAGWYASGDPAPGALENQISFIGPIGAGAMAFEEGRALRDRVFRVVLDSVESEEPRRSYYQATVGLITLLQLSGNLPHAE